MSGYSPPGYNPPVYPPVAPAVPGFGIGQGPGIGRMLIGSVPIPSIFATPPGQLQAQAAMIGGAAGGIGQGEVGGGTTASPFAAAIAQLRTDRLMRLGSSVFNGVTLSDTYLQQMLLAAERLVERELRVFLVPRQIIPVGTPLAEVQQLAAAGIPMVEEPGYPYDTGLFNGMDLETRHRPIITVYRLWYTYQGEGTPLGDASAPLYDIPLDWVQLDRKYGKINLLPSSTFTNLPLNTFLLSMLGGGRDIPFGLKLRYSAGLSNVLTEYPDLVQLVIRKAVISILDDSFLPQSGSISADGLSQSLSRNVDVYRDAADKALGKIASQIKGIRLTVL